jgi:hypothetical protein
MLNIVATKNDQSLEKLRMNNLNVISADSSLLAGLVRASTKRYAQYAKMVEAGQPTGSSYYYPGLIVYQRKNRRAILLDQDEGSVCIYRWQIENDKPRLDLYLAPNPMNSAVLRRCIERANDFNTDHSARILRIDQKDSDAVSSAGFKLQKRRQQFLFSPSDYIDLSGAKLRTVRRNIATVNETSKIEIRHFQQGDEEACFDLLKAWVEAHREHQDSSGGSGYARRMIQLAGKLPEKVLVGHVALINGKLVGYSFGGSIHSGLACYYDTKCDPNIKGLTYFMRRNFLLEMSDYPLVNDGSDGGREGLNQIKQSFRPVAMHQEYRGYQKSNSK